MREPMVRRGRASRQQRLLRTGIGVVAIVAIAALIANALGGDDTLGPGERLIAKVAFAGTVTGEADFGKVFASLVWKEARAITRMLNEWYQTAFVDLSKFGDGIFPTVAAKF